MAIETTVADARANLDTLLDAVLENSEPVIIRLGDGRDVAIVTAEDLRGLIETVHLLRSPANAQRIMSALRRAQAGEGEPESVEKLRRDLGLDTDE